MSISVNNVIVAGNLVRDVEVRYIPSGTAVADITLAVNERRKQGEEWVEDVHFIDITLWGRTAEVAGKYCAKGSAILVEGKLKLDRWETTEGEKRSKLKVSGIRMQMLGGKAQVEEDTNEDPEEEKSESNEEIPF